jgi:hypothetical protein
MVTVTVKGAAVFSSSTLLEEEPRDECSAADPGAPPGSLGDSLLEGVRGVRGGTI